MPQLITFAVCDDIRVEQSGKLTLVGLYGRAIRIGSIPAALPKLCFFAQFDSLPGATVVSIRLVGPGGNLILEVPNQSATPMPHSDIPAEFIPAQLIFQVAPMPLNEQGVYRVEYDFLVWPAFHVDFFVAVDPSLLTQLPLPTLQ